MQKRTNQDNSQYHSSFWFGFALGSATLAAGAFLLGTKQGRKTLHKLLDLSENLEESIMSAAEEVGEVIEEGAVNLGQLQPKPAGQQTNESSLHSLLNKINLFSPHSSKQTKKFFTKE